jgi:hypothetical protein
MDADEGRILAEDGRMGIGNDGKEGREGRWEEWESSSSRMGRPMGEMGGGRRGCGEWAGGEWWSEVEENWVKDGEMVERRHDE